MRAFPRLLRGAMRRSDLLSVRCTLPPSSLASPRSRRLGNTLRGGGSGRRYRGSELAARRRAIAGGCFTVGISR